VCGHSDWLVDHDDVVVVEQDLHSRNGLGDDLYGRWSIQIDRQLEHGTSDKPIRLPKGSAVHQDSTGFARCGNCRAGDARHSRQASINAFAREPVWHREVPHVTHD
jgi:hypothetical protein